MAKILYPIGTLVRIRDEKIEELEDEQGVRYSSGVRMVTEYRKGDDRPYVISTVDDHSKNAKLRFAVGDLKRAKGITTVKGYAQPDDACPAAVAITYEDAVAIAKREVNKALVAVISDMESLHLHSMKDAEDIAKAVVHDHILDEDQ